MYCLEALFSRNRLLWRMEKLGLVPNHIRQDQTERCAQLSHSVLINSKHHWARSLLPVGVSTLQAHITTLLCTSVRKYIYSVVHQTKQLWAFPMSNNSVMCNWHHKHTQLCDVPLTTQTQATLWCAPDTTNISNSVMCIWHHKHVKQLCEVQLTPPAQATWWCATATTSTSNLVMCNWHHQHKQLGDVQLSLSSASCWTALWLITQIRQQCWNQELL